MKFTPGHFIDWIFLVGTLFILYFVLKKAADRALTKSQNRTVTIIEMFSLYILVWLTILTFPELNVPKLLIFTSMFLGLGYADKLQGGKFKKRLRT